MIRSNPICALFFALFLLVNGYVDAQEVDDLRAERGKRIFDAICSVCHGLDGEGQGELGFKLTSREVASWSDEELRQKITYGNLTMGMPRFGREFIREGRVTDFGSFDEPVDIDAIVAYLRAMQRNARAQESGSAATTAPIPPAVTNLDRGRAIFFGRGRCSECHRANGEGLAIGPDLFEVAARLNLDELYDAIVQPSRTIADGYRSKELSLGRGKTVRGMYRNETSHSIELLDLKTRVWTAYDKRAVKMYRPLKDSAMPEGLLEGLTLGEIGELLAFVSMLK